MRYPLEKHAEILRDMFECEGGLGNTDEETYAKLTNRLAKVENYILKKDNSPEERKYFFMQYNVLRDEIMFREKK